MSMPKRVFVTVGSTKFSELVNAMLSRETIDILHELGYTDLCMQYGADGKLFLEQSQRPSKLFITGFDYMPSIEDQMKRADLIISHAGSGSVLEALHMQKPLIVVPNTSLMNNHQVEVAKALSAEGYLLETTPEDISRTIASLKDQTQLRPFQTSGNKRFAKMLDEELGLV